MACIITDLKQNVPCLELYIFFRVVYLVRWSKYPMTARNIDKIDNEFGVRKFCTLLVYIGQFKFVNYWWYILVMYVYMKHDIYRHVYDTRLPSKRIYFEAALGVPNRESIFYKHSWRWKGRETLALGSPEPCVIKQQLSPRKCLTHHMPRHWRFDMFVFYRSI